MKKWLLPLSVVFLVSCGQGGEGTNVDGPRDISISVDIARPLQGIVSVTDARGRKPGELNPVDATITVRNEKDVGQNILVKGIWRDSRGNSYGGFDYPLTLSPGATETVRQGTRSEEVSVLNLSLKPGSGDPDDITAERLTDTSMKIAEGYGMTFSETAGDEIIPSLPITGVANGEAFFGRTVTFREGENHMWRLAISDDIFDPVKGAGIARYENKGLQTIYLDLPSEPAVGRKIVKKMSYGGGIFQIRTTPAADETTSWNTSLAYALEVTSWEKGPSADGPCGDPDVGRATGKVYVSFMGSGMGHSNSWAAGEFKDAAVVYCGVK